MDYKINFHFSFGIYSVLLLSFVVEVKSDVLCEEGFCEKYIQDPGCSSPAPQCRINNSTHSGLWLPSPTICNCCTYCLPFYNENEACSLGGPGSGTSVGRCGPGLTCEVNNIGGVCKRMKTECHDLQDDYDARYDAGYTGALELRPVCDGKGLYGTYHCTPTQTCFCQSEEGKRLFGEVLYQGLFTPKNMHCGCSRLHDRIKKVIDQGVRYPVIGPRCTSDGNFNPVQCINRDCYCVNRVTGAVVGTEQIDLDKQPISELSCYNPSLDLYPEDPTADPPYNYTTPCLTTMEDKIKLMQDSEAAGFNVNYFSSVPVCLPDGTFQTVSKDANGTKICVDEYGKQIEDYVALPNTTEYNNMDCKCAKTNQLLSLSSERPVCCKNGNFRPVQCRRDKCHCVDQDGRQIGKEVDDVTTLRCFSEDWRNC